MVLHAENWVASPIFDIEAYIPKLAANLIISLGNFSSTSFKWLTQLGVITEMAMILNVILE